jgi:hypothetical protein
VASQAEAGAADGGWRISSGAVRAALVVGDADEVAELLGYPWFVTAKVVHGDKRALPWGRAPMMGFTARLGKNCADDQNSCPASALNPSYRSGRDARGPRTAPRQRPSRPAADVIGTPP